MATGTLFISHLALPGEQSVAGGKFVHGTARTLLTFSAFPNPCPAWRFFRSRSNDRHLDIIPEQSGCWRSRQGCRAAQWNTCGILACCRVQFLCVLRGSYCSERHGNDREDEEVAVRGHGCVTQPGEWAGKGVICILFESLCHVSGSIGCLSNVLSLRLRHAYGIVREYVI
jgi:hypothetical protein